MKKADLMTAFNNIEDKYILESSDIKKQQKNNYKFIFALCMCLVLGIILVPSISYQNKGMPKAAKLSTIIKDPTLPNIDVQFEYGSMGYEGYLAYSINDLVSNNPWSINSKLDKLPVYEKIFNYNNAGQVLNSNTALMREKLISFAKKLGYEESDLKIEKSPSDEDVEAIKEKYEGINEPIPDYILQIDSYHFLVDNIKVEIRSDLSIRIEWFNHNEIHGGDANDYSYLKNLGDKLIDKYAHLWNMKKPTLSIIGGDYSIYNEQSYSVYVFDQSNDLTQQILNYNFNNVKISLNEEGNLWLMDIYYDDLSNSLGQYPVISVKEAKGLLLDGYYFTSCPNYDFKETNIKKVELVYRKGIEKHLIPYYKFYVENIDSESVSKINLKEYYTYYVPAIHPEYLNGFDVYDGHFN